MYVVNSLFANHHFSNQAPAVSFDLVDFDIYPDTSDRDHGTSVAGVIGASKNNVCGTGVAYEVNLGGQWL